MALPTEPLSPSLPLDDWRERTIQLLGCEAAERLSRAHVLVVGTGGVGAYAAELICRAGVGEMTLLDADTVSRSNINRQLPATQSTVGQHKVEVMQRRLLDINPDLRLHILPTYLTEEAVPTLLDTLPGTGAFIVDAIDTIAPKCALIAEAVRRGIPIVCSMGAGAKTDITKVQFAALADTYHCGLSKAVRTRLRQVGRDSGRAAFAARLMKVPVVFSAEQANPAAIVRIEGERNKKSTTGTISYLPAVFGCYLAEYVLRGLTSPITPQSEHKALSDSCAE